MRKNKTPPPPSLNKKTPPPPSSNNKVISTNKSGHFGSTIMEGMALGAGSSIGRKVTDMIFSSNSDKQTGQPKPEVVYGSNNYCNILNNRLNECLSKKVDDLSNLKDCSDLLFLIETHKCSNYADASNI